MIPQRSRSAAKRSASASESSVRSRSRGDERPRLLGRRRDVVELVSRLERRGQEEMLVRVARAQLVGADVAADRADDPGHVATRAESLRGRANSASAARSSISAGGIARWKTSSITDVQPKMK